MGASFPGQKEGRGGAPCQHSCSQGRSPTCFEIRRWIFKISVVGAASVSGPGAACQSHRCGLLPALGQHCGSLGPQRKAEREQGGCIYPQYDFVVLTWSCSRKALWGCRPARLLTRESSNPLCSLGAWYCLNTAEVLAHHQFGVREQGSQHYPVTHPWSHSKKEAKLRIRLWLPESRAQVKRQFEGFPFIQLGSSCGSVFCVLCDLGASYFTSLMLNFCVCEMAKIPFSPPNKQTKAPIK